MLQLKRYAHHVLLGVSLQKAVPLAKYVPLVRSACRVQILVRRVGQDGLHPTQVHAQIALLVVSLHGKAGHYARNVRLAKLAKRAQQGARNAQQDYTVGVQTIVPPVLLAASLNWKVVPLARNVCLAGRVQKVHQFVRDVNQGSMVPVQIVVLFAPSDASPKWRELLHAQIAYKGAISHSKELGVRTFAWLASLVVMLPRRPPPHAISARQAHMLERMERATLGIA